MKEGFFLVECRVHDWHSFFPCQECMKMMDEIKRERMLVQAVDDAWERGTY